MGRNLALDKKLQTAICKHLKNGVSIVDTCKVVGISERVYYKWAKAGRDEIKRLEDDETAAPDADKAVFVAFVDATDKALTEAKTVAIATLRHAMLPYTNKSKKVKTFEETRTDKKTGHEFKYKEVTTETTVTTYAGDWRAALEYLKRRHPLEWGDRQPLDVDIWQRAIKDAAAGAFTYDDLIAEYGSREDLIEVIGDESLAAQLFAALLSPAQAEQSEAPNGSEESA